MSRSGSGPEEHVDIPFQSLYVQALMDTPFTREEVPESPKLSDDELATEFGWSKEDVNEYGSRLVEAGVLLANVDKEGVSWYQLPPARATK
jgi:hypothetical protein